ncbi:hypothetical protein UPYG_G00166020 [Umbra pygmaea]|uniref:Protein phosphatase 1 regulatory subunit 15A/B C-terminal domain-containing protein n=1 Tax=Umbra pygmaea TaxID=75934 RepID=A0ABD0WML3_UMBPY
MFRNVNRDEHFSGVQMHPSAPGGHGGSSLRQPSQDSSWLGMFSVVSRPALAFLQKYIPSRASPPALSDRSLVSGWVSGDIKQNFVEAESALLGQLNDLVSGSKHHMSYLQHEHGNTEVVSSGIRAPSWLTAESLSELGIENAAEIDFKVPQQHLSMGNVRGFFSHVVLNAALAQEMKEVDKAQVSSADTWSSYTLPSRATSITAGNWWGGLWGTDNSIQGWLSNLWSKERTGAKNTNSNGHCIQPECGTKAAVAKPTELFIQCGDGESMHGENAGPTYYKEQPTENGSLQTATRSECCPNPDHLPPDHWETDRISDNPVIVGAVTACSDVAVLTPDQDNGYYSLEEEHSTFRLYMLRPLCEELRGNTEMKDESNTPDTPTQRGSGERGPETEESEQRQEREQSATGGTDGEEEEEPDEDEDIEESDNTDSEEETGATAPPPFMPQCSNKAIAFIMGSPCSDDSQSDCSLSDEDDDGFDSEGSSEFTDSASDEDEDDCDSERADSETERLWNSLCQSRDPYNPQNFTAPLITAARVVPSTSAATASPRASPQEDPPSPLSSSPPADEFGSEDESGGSDVDEADSLRLWNSFSSSADPYSPFNFQAPLRTSQPAGPGVKVETGSRWKRHSKPPPSSAPQYRAEEAEERLDSGFSETLPSPDACPTTESADRCCDRVKKVRFCDEVEEFYASEDNEDRRGPWEELARDRFRFLRRVQEVEESISYVFSPTFRIAVYQGLQHHCCSSLLVPAIQPEQKDYFRAVD